MQLKSLIMIFMFGLLALAAAQIDQKAIYLRRLQDDYSIFCDNSNTSERIICEEIIRSTNNLQPNSAGLVIRDVTNYTLYESRVMRRNRFLTNEEKRPVESGIPTSCPEFDSDDSNNAKWLREISNSPYKWIKNIDRNRIPIIIFETECLCRGCIGLKTYKETTALESIPMQTETFVRKIREDGTLEDTTFLREFGCRCDFPRFPKN